MTVPFLEIVSYHHFCVIVPLFQESLGLGPKTLFLCRGGRLQERLLRYLSGRAEQLKKVLQGKYIRKPYF
jgi:hypothetical protein